MDKYNTITVDGREYVLVPVKQFFSIVEECERMGYYDSAGVDNWEGRDHAIDEMREEGFFERFDDLDSPTLREEFFING